MTSKKTTSTIFKKDVEVNKDFLKGTKIRVEKLKPKGLKALARRILKDEEKKDDDFHYKMFIPDQIIDSRQVIRHVGKLMKKMIYPVLDMPVHHNFQWNTESVLDVVLHATVRNSCIEDACNSLNVLNPRKIDGNDNYGLDAAPSPDTVFRRIKKNSTAEWMDKFEKCIDRLVKPFVKARVFTGLVWTALDITPWMFYGDINTRGIMGTKRNKGSNWAFKYMTICITAQREHITLAGSYMTQLMNPQELMKKLIEKSKRYIKGKMGVICDREFFSVPYISALEECGVKFLMFARMNPRIERIIAETKEFPCIRRHDMGKNGVKVEFWLVLVKNEDGEVKTFATNLPVQKEDIERLVELFDLYGDRWTIETSYSMLGEVRARTCTKNFAVRWFLNLFGLLVRNAYYLLNETIVHYGHLTLKTLAELLGAIKLWKKWERIGDFG